MMYEDEYVREVEDPDEITVIRAKRTKRRAVEFPKTVPTLYQIARATFPEKWIKRKGEWSEEDLMQIELEDARRSPFWKTWASQM
jgi:hypothetical protein